MKKFLRKIFHIKIKKQKATIIIMKSTGKRYVRDEHGNFDEMEEGEIKNKKTTNA